MAGYIGSQTPVVSNGSQRKYTFTATAAQTVFTGMDIPNPQQIQVFQNGVRLVITTDYTVSSGTTVTLVNAASAGDSLVVILFADYQLLDTDALTFTGGTTIEGDLTVDTNTLYVDSTNNRVGVGTNIPSKDFELGLLKAMRIQTGSTTYDFTPTAGATDQLVFNSSQASTFYDFKMNGVTKASITANGITFNGDTAAANALDDYEEGTWTPTDGSGAGLTFAASGGRFVRIGSVVNFAFRAQYPATADGSSAAIASLPFVSAGTTGSLDTAGGWTSSFSQNFSAGYLGYVPVSSTTLKIISQSNASAILTNANVSGNNIYGFGTYYLA